MVYHHDDIFCIKNYFDFINIGLSNNFLATKVLVHVCYVTSDVIEKTIVHIFVYKQRILNQSSKIACITLFSFLGLQKF